MSACSGRNYNFLCINVVFGVFLRESGHTAAKSRTNLSTNSGKATKQLGRLAQNLAHMCQFIWDWIYAKQIAPRDTLSSYRVRNGAHPSYRSTLHLCDVVFAWYLSEMCTARHDMVQIACGCAAHTVFVITVAPQMFRCRGGSLSRAHSVGRPPCSQRQCVTTRELFFWMDVIFFQVALGSLPLILPLRDTSFCGLTQERLGGWDETIAWA